MVATPARSPSNRKEEPMPADPVEIERPANQFGEVPDVNTDLYPEGAPAKGGSATPPSGQGGITPHDGISYQDKWPPNPEPSESAKAKGEENDRVLRGEVSQVDLANENLAAMSGGSEEPAPEEVSY